MEEYMAQDNSMKELEADVKRQVNASKQSLRYHIEHQAEICAENYVSHILGLSDEDETKQATKNQYIELFTEEIIKII
jgi:hypothetical protein